MIHIDVSKSFQNIAGFGVMVPYHTEKTSMIYGQPFFESLLNDLGCSIIRTLFLTQDSEIPDPVLLNIQLQDFLIMKSIKPELKIIASIEEPPGVMRSESGKLNPKCYKTFGEYLFKMCEKFEQYGCPIYGFGLQNGPTTTVSDIYDSESYYQMFRTLCTLKEQHEYQTELLAPEDECFLPNKISNIVKRIDADKLTKKYLKILAVRGNIDTSWHSLMWARRTNPSATFRNLYDFIYGQFFDMMKPISQESWIIQSCNDGLSWASEIDYKKIISVRDFEYMFPLPTGGIDLALKISSAMNNGFSSYVYWLASTIPNIDKKDNPDFKDTSKALCNDGKKTIKYQIAKHFFKYVLPGMVRVESLSDNLIISAFKSNKLVVAVVINDGNSIIDTYIEIAGANIKKYTSYISVENEYHQQESETISNNKFPFTMLPKSIVTFVME